MTALLSHSSPIVTLVVQDDQDYADIASHLLAQEDHRVVLATSLQAALRSAEAEAPGLAIIDVVLPDGSGYELCRALRERLPNLPIIFFSSRNRPSDVVAGLTAGADDYIVKPFHPSEFVARVRAILRRTFEHISPS